MIELICVSGGKIERTPNGRDWKEWQDRRLEVPRRHLTRGRQQIFWVRRNEAGISRNDRDERNRKTEPNIPESCRAWCDARAYFHSGDTSFQGGRQRIPIRAALARDHTAQRN